MAQLPAITPPPELKRRGTVVSACGYYKDTAGVERSITCSFGSTCFQETSLTPAIAHCQNEVPVTQCIPSESLPQTTCNSNQACCSTGFFCGKYDINSGSVFIHGCYNDEVSQTAVNPSFIGYDKLPASVTSSFSHPTSSSDSSDNSDLALGVGVIVGGIVAVVLAIWFFWWFCCMRPRNSWWNKRKGKYTPLPDPSQTGYTAPYGASSQTAFPSPAPYSNMGYQMGPVSSPTQNTYGGPTYHEISAVAPPVEAAAASSRPTSNLEWQQTNPGKTVTYRVEYIPANFTPEDVKSRLFSLTDRLRVTVRSLAPSILGDDKQIATIDFPSWNKNSSGPSLSSDAKALNITSVDRDFRGWTPLNRAHEPIVADIIAVTGLAGHAYGSWATEQHMWLRDFLPSEMPNVRVMTYGYNSQLTESMSRQDFDQHAEDFAEGLESVWRSNYFTRPTIFVGHSLGCLIIKQALILSKGWKGRPERLESLVPLLIFLGAPHNGLATDALMTLVKGKASEPLIEDLKPGSPTLKNLSFRFADIAQNIKVLSVFERKETKTAMEKNGKWVREGPRVMMVEKQNAVTWLPLETRVSADADHRELSRLRHTDGDTYGSIKRAISDALEVPVARSSGWEGGYLPSQYQ